MRTSRSWPACRYCSRYHTSFELLPTWWSAEPVAGEASTQLSATLMYFAHRCAVDWVLSFGGVSCLPVSSASSGLCVLQLLYSLSFLEASCASSLAFERVSFAFNRQRWLQAWVDLGREHSSAPNAVDRGRWLCLASSKQDLGPGQAWLTDCGFC